MEFIRIVACNERLNGALRQLEKLRTVGGTRNKFNVRFLVPTEPNVWQWISHLCRHLLHRFRGAFRT